MPQGASRMAQAASEGRGACVCTSGPDDASDGLWERRKALLSQWQSKTICQTWQCQPSKCQGPAPFGSAALAFYWAGRVLLQVRHCHGRA